MASRGQGERVEKDIIIRLHGEMLKHKRGALLHAAQREH